MHTQQGIPGNADRLFGWSRAPACDFMRYLQAEMRERLAKDKGATYTYSVDYVSQTVSLVDEWRIKEAEKVSCLT